MYPLIKKEVCQISSDYSRNTSRYRWKKDWLDSLQKEDKFLLFGDSYMKQSFLNKEKNRFSHWSPRVQELLCRYLKVKQERYFWDFLECYEKEEDTYNHEIPQNNSVCSSSYETKQFEEEEIIHSIASPVTLYENTNNKDVHSNDLTSRVAVHSEALNLQKNYQKKNINHRDITYLKQEISDKTKSPVIAQLLKQWCETSNDTIHIKPSSSHKLPAFLQLYQQEGTPKGTKPFHELYPTPTPEQMKELQRLNKLSIKSKYKPRESEESVIVTQEKRSVGGGRYFIR